MPLPSFSCPTISSCCKTGATGATGARGETGASFTPQEPVTFDVTLDGAPFSGTIQFQYLKIGNNVTLYIPTISQEITAVGVILIPPAQIPPEIMPANSSNLALLCTDSSGDHIARFFISSNNWGFAGGIGLLDTFPIGDVLISPASMSYISA